MADDSSRAREGGEGVGLAALLEPHLDVLSEAARAREAEQAAAERAAAEQAAQAARRRLDEAELMALIFAHLDHDNPRICEGIEWDRLVLLSEPEPPALSRTLDFEPEPPCASAEPEPSASEPASTSIQDRDTTRLSDTGIGPRGRAQGRDGLDHGLLELGRDWIGRSWADDIRPIPAEVLDRPQLDELQRELLIRASRRELPSLNLRRLARARALRHLELFVHACRAERLRFCRVIPGKGIDSKAEPVIKRAVIEWSRGPTAGVLGWAPELDRHGEWGAMILELRAPAR